MPSEPLTFIDLLDLIDACYPAGRGHMICDNLAAHDTDDVLDWFEEHPRWTRHFTPKHASWLNQIECMFSLLLSQARLARGSFTSKEDLRDKVYACMSWRNETEQAFSWSYHPQSWGRTTDATFGGGPSFLPASVVSEGTAR